MWWGRGVAAPLAYTGRAGSPRLGHIPAARCRGRTLLTWWCHSGTMTAVPDVNVKNLAPEVVARLAEQAEAEGMSQQEWIRQTLRRSAARLSPAELLARR